MYVCMLDSLTREVKAAMLDIATADLRTGGLLYVDLVVMTAYSTAPSQLRTRAWKNGIAVVEAATNKRRVHLHGGAGLISFAFHDGD